MRSKTLQRLQKKHLRSRLKSFQTTLMTALLPYQWGCSEWSEREAAAGAWGWARYGRMAPSQCCRNLHRWHSSHSHRPPGPPHGTSYCQLKKQQKTEKLNRKLNILKAISVNVHVATSRMCFLCILLPWSACVFMYLEMCNIFNKWFTKMGTES